MRNGSDLAVPLLSLSQPYTGATAVLVDELDGFVLSAAARRPRVLYSRERLFVVGVLSFCFDGQCKFDQAANCL